MSQTTRDVVETCRGALWELKRRAELGDMEASRQLVEIARQAAAAVQENVVEGNPTILSHAGKVQSWPILVPAHRPSRESTIADVDALQVGSETGINFHGRKSFSLEFPTTKAAFELWGWLNHFQTNANGRVLVFAGKKPPVDFAAWRRKVCKLPRFSKSNYERWWRAAKYLVPLLHGERLEENKRLATSINRGLTPGMVRDDIKKKLRQSFRSLASDK